MGTLADAINDFEELAKGAPVHLELVDRLEAVAARFETAIPKLEQLLTNTRAQAAATIKDVEADLQPLTTTTATTTTSAGAVTLVDPAPDTTAEPAPLTVATAPAAETQATTQVTVAAGAVALPDPPAA